MDLVDTYKFMKIFLIISTFFAAFSIIANPKVYFINLEDGDIVESPFLIQFGLSGMGIAPAGTDRANTGHHHLLINVDDIDLTDFEVSFFIDNKLQEKGNTNNVLDNPLNAVLWLINSLCKKGEPMLKHQFISSGSCTKAYRLNTGTKIKADFGKLGLIEFEYI